MPKFRKFNNINKKSYEWLDPEGIYIATKNWQLTFNDITDHDVMPVVIMQAPINRGKIR